ncbi:MAG: hypothetical protein ISQ09_13240 [Rubripirellula sp.]|nr:hypothetical protein [Rubripirellula sp.]
MSTFLILGMVCCVCAASSSLLIGIFRSAPLEEDFDARPSHRHQQAFPSNTKSNRRERRSSNKGRRIHSEPAHSQLRRRAV